jgi:hypothetical protein
MLSDISHTTAGFKSALMKPLIPFFKKNRAGAVHASGAEAVQR